MDYLLDPFVNQIDDDILFFPAAENTQEFPE